MFKKILVPTDGSELSAQAARAAVQFAVQAGAGISVVAVVGNLTGWAYMGAASGVDVRGLELEIEAEVQQRVDDISALAREHGVPCEGQVVHGEHPSEEIVKSAEQTGCDVIFMASHGRTGMGKLFLGSQTQKVLALSKLPVLVFR